MIIRDRKEFYALAHEAAEASRDFGCIQILDEDFSGFDKLSSGERVVVSFESRSGVGDIISGLEEESKLFQGNSAYDMIAQITTDDMTMADLSSLDEALKRVCTGCRHYKMGLSRNGGKAMDTTDGKQCSGLSLFLFFLN